MLLLLLMMMMEVMMRGWWWYQLLWWWWNAILSLDFSGISNDGCHGNSCDGDDDKGDVDDIYISYYKNGDEIQFYVSIFQVPSVDPRAVQLAVLFLRGLTLTLAVLGACGYPIPLSAGMPWRCFDGKLFHLKFIHARDGATLESLCDYYVSINYKIFKVSEKLFTCF